MPLPADWSSAFYLLRARVAFFEYGMAGEKGDLATVQLPGGSIARFDKRRGTGQLFYASGRPLSVALDMRHASKFASLLHNADCEIYRAIGNVKEDVFPAIDSWVVDRKPMLRTAMDYPDPEMSWVLSNQARENLHAFGSGDDISNSSDDQAFALKSLIRWHKQVDRWILAEQGKETMAYDIDGRIWEQIQTGPGLIAAAREVGELEGRVHRGSRYKSKDFSIEDIVRETDRMYDAVLDDRIEFFALKDASGAARMIVRHHTSDDTWHLWLADETGESLEAYRALRTRLESDSPNPGF